MAAAAGRVILAGVPLGNPGDASARLREALASADVIAAEDTRRLRRLCSDLSVEPTGRIVSFFDQNEVGRVPQLIALLAEGAAGIAVTALPGPSAVTTALALSGLPCDRFCFEGFLPRKSGERARVLSELAREARTLVFFEAPHRLGESLSALAEAFGADRSAAVCRELSKTYEEVRRGPLGELASWALGDVRGEITIVVAGYVGSGAAEPAELAAAVAGREAAGQARKEAIAEVARELGVPKRDVFDAVVAARPR